MMKKIMYLITLFIVSAMFASCEKEEVITESKLPSSSRKFLKTHFEGIDITRIEKETDGLDKDYTVYLANGFEIDFTKSGAWDEVDGHIKAVPQSILDLIPEKIAQYVNTNYSDYEIVKVNKERYGYEIGLNGDIDIKFDSKGNFEGFDD